MYNLYVLYLFVQGGENFVRIYAQNRRFVRYRTI